MDTFQQILIAVGLVLQAILLLAAVSKNRITICHFFLIYLVVDFVSSLILVKTNSRPFYVVQMLSLDLIKIGVALELNRRIFKYYRGVQRSNFLILVGAVLFFFVFHWLTPQKNSDWWFALYSAMHSKILLTTCAIFLYMNFLILLYRLHITIAHKFLILGFLIVQSSLAIGFGVMATFGENARVPMNYLNSVFFVVALIIWTRGYLNNDAASSYLGSRDTSLAVASHSGAAKRNESPL